VDGSTKMRAPAKRSCCGPQSTFRPSTAFAVGLPVEGEQAWPLALKQRRELRHVKAAGADGAV
jgi:hypothetical protein